MAFIGWNLSEHFSPKAILVCVLDPCILGTRMHQVCAHFLASTRFPSESQRKACNLYTRPKTWYLYLNIYIYIYIFSNFFSTLEFCCLEFCTFHSVVNHRRCRTFAGFLVSHMGSAVSMRKGWLSDCPRWSVTWAREDPTRSNEQQCRLGRCTGSIYGECYKRRKIATTNCYY